MKNSGLIIAEVKKIVEREETEEAPAMLEQLPEHYENFCLPLGIKGHVVCYHNYRPDGKISIVNFEKREFLGDNHFTYIDLYKNSCHFTVLFEKFAYFAKFSLVYHFPKGVFTINCFSGEAIHWNYDSK